MPVDRTPGHYLGTEIDEKWWKRYLRKGFFARGSGEYWYDAEAFYFLRYLTADPIIIRFADVVDLKVGTWHAGRWALGRSVVKLLWSREGQSLSSGFVLPSEESVTSRLLDEPRHRLSVAASGPNASPAADAPG
jgi:hypothetical protein